LTPLRRVADWLTLAGAVVLFISLFLTWSHQVPPVLAGSPAVRGVPANPTAWQVYAVADVLLAVLAAALAYVALRGRARWAAWTLLAAVAVGLAFAAHAADSAPTNGVLVAEAGHYVSVGATAGVGETLAIVALGIAAIGLLLSLLAQVREIGS
jgi:hypothetical protein